MSIKIKKNMKNSTFSLRKRANSFRYAWQGLVALVTRRAQCTHSYHGCRSCFNHGHNPRVVCYGVSCNHSLLSVN